MEPLPRTTTGKIRRHEIQKRLREHAATADAETRPLRRRMQNGAADANHAAAMTVIAQRLERTGVRPDANLELDLGLDSMERVELLTMLEQRQGTRVAADARATIFTVRQLIAAVAEAPRVGGQSDSATSADAAADLPWETLLAAPADPAVTALTGQNAGRFATSRCSS
jgi:long-chain acyl-CoA synthetase